MTINAASAQVADPPPIVPDRLALTRGTLLPDSATSYLTGFSDGNVYGLTLGVMAGRVEGFDRGEEEGQEDGIAVGLRVGVGVSTDVSGARAAGAVEGDRIGFQRGFQVVFSSGYDQGFEDGAIEGAATALPLGLATGQATAPSTAETTPPFIGTVAPAASTSPGDPGGFPADFASARVTPIEIPVADVSTTVAFVAISVLYFDRSTWETIYVGRPATDGDAGFLAGYTAGSTVTGTGLPGVGFTFSVRNDAGWPAQNATPTTIEFRINAVDSVGNVLA